MTQRTTAERPYLSIGEVLGLLLEEFPDITISKIRFLESQGLIVPERTASGYRKFYDEDVERLRYILTEQKDKCLPLRVIKDRLDTPPTGIDRPEPQRKGPQRPEPRGINAKVLAFTKPRVMSVKGQVRINQWVEGKTLLSSANVIMRGSDESAPD